MTENGIDIQTITTKRTDKQADRVLLLRHVEVKNKKAHLSHFLKFFLPATQTALWVLPDTKADPSQNPKSCFFDPSIALNYQIIFKWNRN